MLTEYPFNIAIGRTREIYRRLCNQKHSQHQVDLVDAEFTRVGENKIMDDSTGQVISIFPSDIGEFLKEELTKAQDMEINANGTFIDNYGVLNLYVERFEGFETLLEDLSWYIDTQLDPQDFIDPKIQWNGNYVVFNLVVNPSSLVLRGRIKVACRLSLSTTAPDPLT